MKFVAIYKEKSGDIIALCALPPAGGGTPGMQLGPGEASTEIDAPSDFASHFDDPELHKHMNSFLQSYRIENQRPMKIAAKP